MHLKFRHIPGSFAICRLAPDALPPQWTTTATFTSITRSEDGLSIVCPAEQAPDHARCEAPWICFKLEGPLPFSQSGVLASFIDPLAERGVPIFAISSFDTDYILVKEESAATALATLKDAGHELIS